MKQERTLDSLSNMLKNMDIKNDNSSITSPLYGNIEVKINKLIENKDGLSNEEIISEFKAFNDFIENGLNGENINNQHMAVALTPLISNILDLKSALNESLSPIQKALNTNEDLKNSLFSKLMTNTLMEVKNENKDPDYYLNTDALGLIALKTYDNYLPKVNEELKKEFEKKEETENTIDSVLSKDFKNVKDYIFDEDNIILLDEKGEALDEETLENFKNKLFEDKYKKEKNDKDIKDLTEDEKESKKEGYYKDVIDDLNFSEYESVIENDFVNGLLNEFDKDNNFNLLELNEDYKNDRNKYLNDLNQSNEREEKLKILKGLTNNFKNNETFDLFNEDLKNNLVNYYGKDEDSKFMLSSLFDEVNSNKFKDLDGDNIIQDNINELGIKLYSSTEIKYEKNLNNVAKMEANGIEENLESSDIDGELNKYLRKESLKFYGIRERQNIIDKDAGDNVFGIKRFFSKSLMHYNEFGVPDKLMMEFSVPMGKVHFTPKTERDPVALEASLFYARKKGWKKLNLSHGGNNVEAAAYFDAMLTTITNQIPPLYSLDDVILPPKFKNIMEKHKNKASMENGSDEPEPENIDNSLEQQLSQNSNVLNNELNEENSNNPDKYKNISKELYILKQLNENEGDELKLDENTLNTIKENLKSNDVFKDVDNNEEKEKLEENIKDEIEKLKEKLKENKNLTDDEIKDLIDEYIQELEGEEPVVENKKKKRNSLRK